MNFWSRQNRKADKFYQGLFGSFSKTMMHAQLVCGMRDDDRRRWAGIHVAAGWRGLLPE
jgi:hypothetical protein